MIKLELNDWLFNAGMVGFYKILLESGETKETHIDNNYFEFDEKLLEDFEYKYFNFFIEKYTSFTPYGKIVSNKGKLEQWNNNISQFDENSLKELNEIGTLVKTKLSRSSYISAYKIIDDGFDVLNIVKGLSSIKLNKNQNIDDIIDTISQQINTMIDIISYMEEDHVKKILLSKEFTYTFTNEFLSNVAIWSKNNSDKSAYMVYKDFFVDPVLNYKRSDTTKFKMNCINCDRKINNEFGTGLAWINAMGADSAKKPAHYWNFVPDMSVCPVCTLIYSCIPAGFQYLHGIGFFINDNSSFDRLIKLNSPIDSMVDSDEDFSIEKLELESYYKVADVMRYKSQKESKLEINNIQIVKYNSSNSRRPYTFNILDKKIAYIISESDKLLKLIVKKRISISKDEYMNPYDETIKRIFNNQNLYDLIHKLIHFNLEGKAIIFYADVIMGIQKYIVRTREEKGMDKQIERSKFCGIDLRKKYVKSDNGKKVNTITYKLLNALKTKNAGKFLDIIINAHMSMGMDVPDIFVQTLKDEEKLLGLGYAFVVGLQSADKEQNKNENNIQEKV